MSDEELADCFEKFKTFEIMSNAFCNICNLKDNCPCLEDEMCPYSDNECIKMWIQSEVKEV